MFSWRVIARTQTSGKRHGVSACRDPHGDGAPSELHAGGKGADCGRGVSPRRDREGRGPAARDPRKPAVSLAPSDEGGAPTGGLPTFVPVMVTPEPDVLEQSTLPSATSPPAHASRHRRSGSGGHAARRGAAASRGSCRSNLGGSRAAGVSDIGTGIMIPVPTGVRVWLSTGHTDMRKGWASLALLVQECQPTSG